MANTTLKFGNGNWAIKDGSALAYSDQYDNYKPLPFDFSRASSATLVNKAGLIESVNSGLPRIDFSHSIDGALLLEPQSTNLIPYSDDFSQSSWVKNGFGNALSPVVTSNSDISPDGNQNASRIEMDCTSTSSSDYSAIYQQLALDGSSEYTISFYVKSNTSSEQDLLFFSNSSFSTQITADSEWQRVESTFTSNSTNTRNFGLVARGSVQQDVDILIWGAQVENRSYATSYIPTSGASATRNQELCADATPVINSEEGTLYAEVSNVSKEDVSNIALTDGTNSQRVQIYFNKYALSLMFFVRVDGVLLATHTVSSSGINYEETNKIAIKYKTNDISFWLNGTKVGTDTTGTLIPNKFTQLGFNSGGGGAFFGSTKDLKYYPKALADVQLEDLTTI